MVFDSPVSYGYGPDLVPTPLEQGSGIWRWRRLLPFDASGSYPLQIGDTPLVVSERLRQASGLPGLVLKDETRTPTGSNKDRATALCVVDAVQRRAKGIAAASSGNVAVSLAAGAAALGLPAFLFVSERSVSPRKVRLMRAFGATVFLVKGTYEQAYRLSGAACERFDWYNRNTGQNPLAIEGKKTVAFEVWEQLGRSMPEVVYLPVGDGVTLAAYARGCEELVRCGVAKQVPRLVGVQARGAAPLARAFRAGTDAWKKVRTATIADGIDVGDPCYGKQALAAARQSGGKIIAVDDDQLRAAINLLARTTGILAEPAGVAALAGALADQAVGVRDSGQVLALLSGTGLKDQRWLLSRAGRAVAIPARIESVSTALDPLASPTVEKASPGQRLAARRRLG